MLIDFSIYELDKVEPPPANLCWLSYCCTGDDCPVRGEYFGAWDIDEQWASPCCNAPVRLCHPPKKRRY